MPIFDQGYQHWQGQLSSGWWRWWTITRYGVRANFKSIWIKIILFPALVPALLLAGAVTLWGFVEQQSEFIQPLLAFLRLPPELTSGPKAYREAVWSGLYYIFFWVQSFYCMILMVAIGPGLVSQDLRFNAMPLYFSRPLTRFDYFLGKFGVIAVYILAVTAVPALLAYLLGLLFSLDLSVIRDTAWLIPAVLAHSLVITVSAGTLMLALSSLSRSSIFVGLFWVGVWWVSFVVSAALTALHMIPLQFDLARKEQALASSVRRGEMPTPEAVKEVTEARKAVIEAAGKLWQPICSYTHNLDRIGAELLDTASATKKFVGLITRNRPKGVDLEEPIVAEDHPWQWSAGVLLGLFGISLWVLTSRVKSLDRLR